MLPMRSESFSAEAIELCHERIQPPPPRSSLAQDLPDPSSPPIGGCWNSRVFLRSSRAIKLREILKDIFDLATDATAMAAFDPTSRNLRSSRQGLCRIFEKP